MPERDLFGEVPTPKPRSRSDSSASQARHTWFFALRPCADDALRIQAFAERLLAAHGITGKRIAPERLHITLDLVGHDIDETAVTRACRAADSVRFHPIEARFDAVMTFSAPSGPFVLLGGEGLNDVRAFRLLLGQAMAAQGFAPPLSYEPHMTLCYDARHRTARTAVESIGFRTAEFALVKSHIGLSRHEIIQTWSIDAPPA